MVNFAYTIFIMSEENKLITRDWLAIERTKLANERTFLAYFRTVIVIFGSGIAILKLEILSEEYSEFILNFIPDEIRNKIKLFRTSYVEMS